MTLPKLGCQFQKIKKAKSNKIQSQDFIKYCKFCSDFSKKAIKYTIFFNIQKAKSFYFWQTVSKRPNLDDLVFQKANWQPCAKLSSKKEREGE